MRRTWQMDGSTTRPMRDLEHCSWRWTCWATLPRGSGFGQIRYRDTSRATATILPRSMTRRTTVVMLPVRGPVVRQKRSTQSPCWRKSTSTGSIVSSSRTTSLRRRPLPIQRTSRNWCWSSSILSLRGRSSLTAREYRLDLKQPGPTPTESPTVGALKYS